MKRNFIFNIFFAYSAGSRNETYDTQGASHMLRVAGGLTNKNTSGFLVTRNIQQKGGALTVTSDREVVAYTVETTSNHLETGLRYLQDVIHPAFKPWELADVVPLVKTQVANVPPQVSSFLFLREKLKKLVEFY